MVNQDKDQLYIQHIIEAIERKDLPELKEKLG